TVVGDWRSSHANGPSKFSFDLEGEKIAKMTISEGCSPRATSGDRGSDYPPVHDAHIADHGCQLRARRRVRPTPRPARGPPGPGRQGSGAARSAGRRARAPRCTGG